MKAWMDQAGLWYKALVANHPSDIEKPCVSVEGFQALPGPEAAIDQDEWNARVTNLVNQEQEVK